MLEKHLVFTGESPPRNFTTNRVKKRTIKSEDPMSHRIIEKRRRDRMNNCLADLSRLIPPEYLKKGRGRIEKTEIIEMAIKHIGHLQNMIATTRFNENSNGSVPSPPGPTAMMTREPPPPLTVNQPAVVVVTAKHYKMGYLECMSEAMHFLVEVQGYFAGDSLCVEMINHLRKHCDKVLKENNSNGFKKYGEDGLSSDSSVVSPINENYSSTGSSPPPPLRLSNSTGSSISDENQSNQLMEMRTIDEDYYSTKKCTEINNYGMKRNSESFYPKYVDYEGIDNENRYDSESRTYSIMMKCRNNEIRKDESKYYYNSIGTPNVLQQNSKFESYENLPLKHENGPSQLREMLTSPSPLSSNNNNNNNVVVGRYANARCVSDVKGSFSPTGNPTGMNENSNNNNNNFKSSSNVECHENNENHGGLMYKFKNNIKQRFSKENEEILGERRREEQMVSPKKQKTEKCFDGHIIRERLSLGEEEEKEDWKNREEEEEKDEKIFKYNTDLDGSKRLMNIDRESIIHDKESINKINYSRRANDKYRKWEESRYNYHNGQKLWGLSPPPPTPPLPPHSLPLLPPPTQNVPICSPSSYGQSHPPMICKSIPIGTRSEFSPPVTNNNNNNYSSRCLETGYGIPIFALHSKGSFYVPLTLDHATLAPFLNVLGVTKRDDDLQEKTTVLHPVTISVNFQSHLMR